MKDKVKKPKLSESESRYKALFEYANDAIFLIKDGVFVDCNTKTLNMFTCARDEIIGQTPDRFSPLFQSDGSASAEKARKKIQAALHGSPQFFEWKHLRYDGALFDAEVSLNRVEIDNVKFIHAIVRDITERRQAEELFKTLAHNSQVGVCIVQTGKLKFVNRYFERITGYAESELLDKDSMVLVLPEDRDFVRERALEMLKNERMPAYEIRVLTKTGEIKWILQSITSIQFKGKPAVLGNFVDITEKKQMEEKLRTMSIIDELTQLYNRRGFFTLAAQQMKNSSRNKKEMLLFFIDLDGLKWINDTLGHQEGDLALIGTANILRETFRDADVIGRIGGDEFVILAVGTSGISGTTKTLLEKRLQEHIDLYNSEIDILHKLSMSVGIAIYNPEHPSTIDELMSKADTSMYEDKKKKSFKRDRVK